MNKREVIGAWLLCLSITIGARHPFRLANPLFPHLTIQWADGSQKNEIINRYIRYYPLFSFDITNFEPYRLPDGPVSFRSDASESINGEKLSALIEEALHEILQRKRKIKKDKSLRHFKVLQHKNFNYRKSCGLLVLAFKEYPFVVKLFMEKPNTILDFHLTGIEPSFFFYMGGGSNRYLSGFTRLLNRTYIIDRVAGLDRWKDHVEIPRKWFWLPKHSHHIIISGENIGPLKTVHTTVPSIYAIIADKIDCSKQTPCLLKKTKNQMIMELCNDLELNIDPHAKNFAFDESASQFKIILVDTEHFPTMVGLSKKRVFRNHNEWYLFLAGKCFSDMYLKTKRDLFRAGEQSVLLHHPDFN